MEYMHDTSFCDIQFYILQVVSSRSRPTFKLLRPLLHTNQVHSTKREANNTSRIIWVSRLGKTHKLFLEKCPLDIALRQLTPFREMSILKHTKNRFFSEVGRSNCDMVLIFQDAHCTSKMRIDLGP